jgi:fumarylacetoacetase
MKSFIPVSADSHFPLENLPYGIGRPAFGGEPRLLTRIGNTVVDLAALEAAGLFEAHGAVLPEGTFAKPALNDFMALGREAWTAARRTITRFLSEDSVIPLGRVDTTSIAFHPID